MLICNNTLTVSIPEDAPKWMTEKYVIKCIKKRNKINKKWKPKIGDWFCCADIYEIKKIKTLAKYYSAGDSCMKLSSDCSRESDGSWPCDTYIPTPIKLKQLLNKK